MLRSEVDAERERILRTAYGMLDRGDLASFCAVVYDPEVITVDPSLGNPVGRDAVVAEHLALRRAYPVLRWRVDDVLFSGTMTVVRLSARGAGLYGRGSRKTPARPVTLHFCEVDEWLGDVVVTRQWYGDRRHIGAPAARS